MSADVPSFSLPRFEGPLDLLLALVRKNQVDIADIPIANITRQYLDYLHQAGELNIDLGSEFVYMAALLIHIKSRCLLASDPELAGHEEDPRAELVRQLLDYDQVRHGAEFLKQKLQLAEVAWSRSSVDDFWPAPTQEVVESTGVLNLLQVLRLAQQALAAARAYEVVAPSDSVTVEEMMRWLDERLVAAPDSLEATALLTEQPDAPHRAALFLAMLEMAKSARIRLEQQQCFGPISIEDTNMAHPCHDVDYTRDAWDCWETQ
jgi:segregation and condensation protein A